MARSMSGELAIILWAARTPVRDRVPPSRPVLVSLHHILRKNRNRTTQDKTANPALPQTFQGYRFPQCSNEAR